MMMKTATEKGFREYVYEAVAQIPFGKLATYGDIAAIAGKPFAARLVGGVAHFGPSDLPWHRVVNRFGGLASGYPGGRTQQKTDLESEGLKISDEFVVINFDEFRWNPYLRKSDGE